MCSSPTIRQVAAPASAVPLPTETVKPVKVETQDPKLRRSGRSRLSIPNSTGATTSGMSGLNIPT